VTLLNRIVTREEYSIKSAQITLKFFTDEIPFKRLASFKKMLMEGAKNISICKDLAVVVEGNSDLDLEDTTTTQPEIITNTSMAASELGNKFAAQFYGQGEAYHQAGDLAAAYGLWQIALFVNDDRNDYRKLFRCQILTSLSELCYETGYGSNWDCYSSVVALEYRDLEWEHSPETVTQKADVYTKFATILSRARQHNPAFRAISKARELQPGNQDIEAKRTVIIKGQLASAGFYAAMEKKKETQAKEIAKAKEEAQAKEDAKVEAKRDIESQSSDVDHPRKKLCSTRVWLDR